MNLGEKKVLLSYLMEEKSYNMKQIETRYYP